MMALMSINRVINYCGVVNNMKGFIMSSTSRLETLINHANQHFDLTDSSHQDHLLSLADALLELNDISSSQLIALPRSHMVV